MHICKSNRVTFYGKGVNVLFNLSVLHMCTNVCKDLKILCIHVRTSVRRYVQIIFILFHINIMFDQRGSASVSIFERISKRVKLENLQ